MSIEEKIKTAKEDSWLKDSVSEKEFKEIKDNEKSTIKFRFIKADFLSTDELVDYLEKNSISITDIVGTFQEEIFKSYGTPVYKYILIYQTKGENE